MPQRPSLPPDAAGRWGVQDLAAVRIPKGVVLEPVQVGAAAAVADVAVGSDVNLPPGGPNTVVMRPGLVVASGRVGAAVPTRAAVGSRWWASGRFGGPSGPDAIDDVPRGQGFGIESTPHHSSTSPGRQDPGSGRRQRRSRDEEQAPIARRPSTTVPAAAGRPRRKGMRTLGSGFRRRMSLWCNSRSLLT